MKARGDIPEATEVTLVSDQSATFATRCRTCSTRSVGRDCWSRSSSWSSSVVSAHADHRLDDRAGDSDRRSRLRLHRANDQRHDARRDRAGHRHGGRCGNRRGRKRDPSPANGQDAARSRSRRNPGGLRRHPSRHRDHAGRIPAGGVLDRDDQVPVHTAVAGGDLYDRRFLRLGVDRVPLFVPRSSANKVTRGSRTNGRRRAGRGYRCPPPGECTATVACLSEHSRPGGSRPSVIIVARRRPRSCSAGDRHRIVSRTSMRELRNSHQDAPGHRTGRDRKAGRSDRRDDQEVIPPEQIETLIANIGLPVGKGAGFSTSSVPTQARIPRT
jgi:hypothetical protein